MRSRRGLGVPAVDVVERLRGLVGFPQNPDLPFERLADGLDDARRGVFEVALLRKDRRQRMIGLPEDSDRLRSAMAAPSTRPLTAVSPA